MAEQRNYPKIVRTNVTRMVGWHRIAQSFQLFVEHFVAAKASSNFTSLPSNIKAAAEAGDVRAIRRWAAIDTTDVDARDDDGTCSHARFLQIEVNTFLIVGCTALHYASKGGHGDIVRLLLEAGADVNSEDNERVTALHLAARHGFGLCVKVLLDGGSNPSAMDNSGKTAVENAQSSGNVGCVLLIQRRINLENSDPKLKMRLRSTPSSDNV